MDFQKIKKYLEENARPKDLALYYHHFENGSSDDVMEALAAYQNEDGGFGNAVEPDFRLPQSTALATWMAFQTIKQLDVDPKHPMIQDALKYLTDTYDAERVGWAIVRPEVDEYPHAPWWDHKTAVDHFSWANPNAEILGLLIKYGKDNEFDGIIEPMKERAIKQITEVDPSDFHDAFNYKALYELGDDELRAALKKPVEDLVLKAVTTDSTKWKDYVAAPLKFVESPSDEMEGLFDERVIEKNLDFIEDGIVDGDHWEPNWNWSGNYPEVWKKAKVEWSGHLTVENLRILKNFGRV